MTDHSRRLDTHPKDDPADDFATGQVPEADLAAPPSMAPPPPATKSRARFRAFLILGIVILLGAAAWLIHALTRSPSEATDDAYVGGNVVAITADQYGYVAITFGGIRSGGETGFYLYGPDGNLAEDGGGAQFTVGTMQAILPGALP